MAEEKLLDVCMFRWSDRDKTLCGKKADIMTNSAGIATCDYCLMIDRGEAVRVDEYYCEWGVSGGWRHCKRHGFKLLKCRRPGWKRPNLEVRMVWKHDGSKVIVD